MSDFALVICEIYANKVYDYFITAAVDCQYLEFIYLLLTLSVNNGII